MPVFIMQVLDAKPHPNAEALRVYDFGGGPTGPIQVVANLSNVYDVGQRVAVACVGSELLDGTKIRPARLRGVDSFGMALGVHSGAVGTDVSSEFEANVVSEATSAPEGGNVVSWPSIELLHHVRNGLRTLAELQQSAPPRVSYRCKVKLDGTNAGVQIFPDGRVRAQSRTQLLDESSDNMGFGAWVKSNEVYFRSLARAELVVVFGEWCGRGIQKRAAISAIDRRIFAVFALQYGDGTSSPARLEVEPERLRALLPEHADVFVLPWLSARFELDFADDVALTAAAERVNALVNDVETQDPWVEATFGVSGLGEGIVLYPELGEPGLHDRTRLSELMFKAKGEKHQTVRQKKPAQIDPEVARGVEEFAALVLPLARLEQGLNEACGGVAQMSGVGSFLKWVLRDVQKECGVELAASGLNWEQVNRAVSSHARTWFIARAKA